MGGGRIVTLLASATEIASALGLRDRLAAVSHECDYPSSVIGLPVCTSPKIDVHAPSSEIDRRVREIVEQGLSVYRVDGEALRAIDPDLIVTQTQCEVCAVSERDVLEAVESWLTEHTRVVSLRPNALTGIWDDIRRVADAAGVPARGNELVDALQQRMRTVETAAAGTERRPRVACIEWIDPLMAAGNWVPELVAMAGGINLFGEAGRHAPWMTWEALVAADPDVIVTMPCGFDIPRTRAELTPLLLQPGWTALRAVREGRVFLADGNQYFNRPGPRIAASLEMLAEILHPTRFHFGYEGAGWVRL